MDTAKNTGVFFDDGFVHHDEAVLDARNARRPVLDNVQQPAGFAGILNNKYATLCAAFVALGGLIFGYDQGVVSIVLVMPQFVARFEQVSEHSTSAGFDKGLLTAMIELGALIGALNQGWIADTYSRKYSIVIAVVIFTIGSILQTASIDYAILVIARLIGGPGKRLLLSPE